MISDSENYYAKLLLFGEYLLLMGSDALVIPIRKYNGKLDFNLNQNTIQRNSSDNLKMFFEFLKTNESKFPSELKLNLAKFHSDLEMGLYFVSDIPIEYGLGSSGALVAAIYSRYSMSHEQELDSSSLLKLKTSLAFMESYFHGSSSGTDPLSCFVGKPLLLRSDSTIELVHFPTFKDKPDFAFFLLDSQTRSKTQDMVSIFRTKLEKGEFRNQLQQELIPLNNNCIENLIKRNSKEFLLNVKRFSRFQLEYFSEMIPLKIHDIWVEGVEKQLFTLKLCGSGGGGFILGISDDYTPCLEYFKQKGMDLIRIIE